MDVMKIYSDQRKIHKRILSLLHKVCFRGVCKTSFEISIFKLRDYFYVAWLMIIICTGHATLDLDLVPCSPGCGCLMFILLAIM